MAEIKAARTVTATHGTVMIELLNVGPMTMLILHLLDRAATAIDAFIAKADKALGPWLCPRRNNNDRP